MKTKPWMGLCAVAAVAGWACESEVRLKSDHDRISYSIGYSVGKNLKSTLQESGDSTTTDVLIEGIRAALRGSSNVMTDEEMIATLKHLSEVKTEAAKGEFERVSQENKTKGETYLAENRQKAGVIELPSGIQYRVIRKGEGAIPTLDDTVLTHYAGRFVDGEEFDSSYKREVPVDFPVKGVIPGWQEVLQMMPVGSKWEVVVPAGLAYGERGPQGMPPNATLTFEMELIEIKGKQ